MIRIPVSRGMVAEIREPTRGEYPQNLGGAFEYSVTHLIYKVLEIAGEAIGVFLAGSAIKFLETIEPHMVEYVSPLIDGLLSIPDMPVWFRDYLNKIRNPQHEVGVGLLETFSGTMVQGITGSLLGAVFEPFTQRIRKATRAGLPDPTTLVSLFLRGRIAAGDAQEGLARQGYTDQMISQLHHVIRPRLDPSSLAEGVRRGAYGRGNMYSEMKLRGFVDEDLNTTMGLIDALYTMPEIFASYYRGEIGESDALRRLGKLGYNKGDAVIILRNSKVIPPITDLVTMAVREAWRDDVAAQWGYDEEFSGEFASWAEKQGMSAEWAKRYWRSHWSLPSVNLGFQMYHRKIITEGELFQLLKIADYPRGWRDNMVKAAYQPITRVDVRRFYRLGLFDHAELVRRYEFIGYSPVDAVHMADFTVAYEDGGGDDTGAQARNITRTLIEKAFRLGKLTREESQLELRKLGYRSTHVELMLSIVDMARELDAVPDYLTEYRDDMRNVLLRSYTKRMITAGELRNYLINLGFDSREADFQMQVADFAYNDARRDRAISLIGENYVRRTIDRNRAYGLLGGLNVSGSQQDQIFLEWELERTLRTRKLTEAQYRKLYQNDVFSIEVYKENMRGLGYSEPDVGYLALMAG